MIVNTLTFFVAALFLAFPSPPESHAGDWDSWQFLLGQWTAEGEGRPGQSAGTFSFILELQGKILVRRNRADYPATKDRPAFSHEDLMVIYPETPAQGTRAIYFDNEGHVIHYAVKFSESGNRVTFSSDPMPSGPRFRLTYTRGKGGAMATKFEIAPAEKPDSFSTYVEGIARHAKAP